MWTLATNDLDRSLTGPSLVDLDQHNLEKKSVTPNVFYSGQPPLFLWHRQRLAERRQPLQGANNRIYIKVALSQRGSFRIFQLPRHYDVVSDSVHKAGPLC